jgi:transposase
LNNNPLSTSRIAKLYKTDTRRLQKAYKEKLSGYNDWEQKAHAEDWILYGKNLGFFLSIDETSLSNGELYTIVTNKFAKGGSGAIVAIIKGTKSKDIIKRLNTIALYRRNMVKEITVDMAGSMNLIAKKCFPKATIVTDRFHVQMLASEAVQEQRIKLRWEAIDLENDAMSKAKMENEKFLPFIFSNGDTRKQLLARSRFLLFKSPAKWSKLQAMGAEVLFKEYPTIKETYQLSQKLSFIFENTTDKDVARVKLAKWYNDVEASGYKSFNSISRTIFHHYENILNYFNNRSTNASAESFNAKIKDFRRQLRGVRDISFFLFRLCKLYA